MAALWAETACAAEVQFVPRVAYPEYTNAIDAANWMRNAINERWRALGSSYDYLQIPASGDQQDYLSTLKSAAQGLISSYVDQTKASGNSFDGYFSTPFTNGVYPTTFPIWTVTGLLTHCSLPTNFFEYTPWRPFEGHGVGVTNQYTYGGFTTLDYGWEGLRLIVRNLKWTANGGNSWWIMSKWSYSQSTNCAQNPCSCDGSISCNLAPSIDYTEYGVGDSLTVHAECYSARVTDRTNGTFYACRAGSSSTMEAYTAKHVANGLPANFPGSVVDFYQMNKLDNYTNFSTRCYVSGLDWNGCAADMGDACPENEEYWTNCVWSSYAHPFQYVTAASISSSGTAYSTTYFLDVVPIPYFSGWKTYYCTVNGTPWSFETSSSEAREQYTGITLHLNRWAFTHGDD